MNKLLIFGILCMIILTGCSPKYDNLSSCKENILDLSCDNLRNCDLYCNDESSITGQLSCHGYFTNQIIAECKE